MKIDNNSSFSLRHYPTPSNRGSEFAPAEKIAPVQPVKEIQRDERRELTADETKAAIEKANKMFKQTHVEFKMHEESGKYFVQIVDEARKEVIRQIPSREFLDMVADTKQQLGLLLDERV